MIWTVLGSSGTIGSYLTDKLIKSGDVVFTPGRGDPLLFKKPLGHVIYCIGLTGDFRFKPFETVEAHILHLSELLQFANFDSFLYLSSTRVYSRCSNTREDDALLVLPEDPSDLYNISKLMGESLCLRDDRKSVRVIRLSNVYGGNDQNSNNFLPTIIREARKGKITLQSSLISSKDYIHIDDVVDLIPKIAINGRKRLYNVASGILISNAQITKKLIQQTGCDVDVLTDAQTVTSPHINNERIKSEFFFNPQPVLDALGIFNKE